MRRDITELQNCLSSKTSTQNYTIQKSVLNMYEKFDTQTQYFLMISAMLES